MHIADLPRRAQRDLLLFVADASAVTLLAFFRRTILVDDADRLALELFSLRV